MQKGKDCSAKFDGLYLVHQNIPGKKATSLIFDTHVLFIPLQGELTIATKSKTVAFGLGQMLYLPPHTEHSCISSEKLGERLIVMIENKRLSPANKITEPVQLPLNQFIKELLFYLLLHPQSKSSKALILAFAETLQEILEGALVINDSDFLMGKVSDPRVRDALTSIQENLSGSVSMVAVAKKAGLSTRNFNRVVVKETGLSPKQWLIQFRIEKARELLKVPHASVTDVAYAVGYSSLGQFISTFRSRTGQLPSEFLRRG